MTTVWHGSPGPRPPHGMSRRERSGWVIVTGLALAGLVVGVAAVLHFAVVSVSNALNRGFDLHGLEQTLASEDAAEKAAGAAQGVAGSGPSTLTPATLNAEVPGYSWVDGATNVPQSSPDRPVVGVTGRGGHIVTAVRAMRGECTYAVIVTSPGDPLIAEDQLPGPGTFGRIVSGASPCSADAAPSWGWYPRSPPRAPSDL